MQNQQLGGRVYTMHARPLVHRAQHIAGIIEAQEGSRMHGRSSFEARRDRAFSVYGQRDNSREDNKLS